MAVLSVCMYTLSCGVTKASSSYATSVDSFQNSIVTLDLSGNGLTNLSDLYDFKNLRFLYAKQNKFQDLPPILSLLENLYNLENFDLSGSPVAKTVRYREMVTMANTNLRKFNKLINFTYCIVFLTLTTVLPNR